jgi:hypothetical protein
MKGKIILLFVCLALTNHILPNTLWEIYEFNDAFQMNIPDRLEIRNKEGSYTQQTKMNDEWENVWEISHSEDIIFQQKQSQDTYFRIIIHYKKGISFDYPNAQDTLYLDENEIDDINNSIYSKWEKINTSVLNQPEVFFKETDNINALTITYVREGYKESSTIQVKEYYFFNNDEYVHITTLSRERDEINLANEIEDIILSFKWKNIKKINPSSKDYNYTSLHILFLLYILLAIIVISLIFIILFVIVNKKKRWSKVCNV